MNEIRANELLRKILDKRVESQVQDWEDLCPVLIGYAKSACRRHGITEDPEEISQAVLVRMYDRQVIDGDVIHYYVRAVNNSCKKLLRKDKMLPLDDEEAQKIPDSSPVPEEETLRNERLSELNSALDAVNSNQRQALLLKYRDGLDAEGIAKAMDVSTSAVYSLIKRGKKQLRNSLDYELM